MSSEDFLTRFHSLDGTTIGERRKNLFLLLRDFPNSDALDFSFQPVSPLEEKLKVDVLIHFRRASELLDLLKGENPILIEKVLRVPWLLEETAGKITGEDLACKLFPFISFNAKAKLLNKLATVLKERQGDEFYQAVEKKYGLYLASKLLGACSAQHVLNCVKSKRVKLTPRQMLVLTKRDPVVAEELLRVMKDKDVDIKEMYGNVLKYLSLRDYALYKKSDNQYKYRVKFGRRITKKFLRGRKGDVIENPRVYYDFLHNKQLARSLKNEYAVLFQNFFPKNLNKLSPNDELFCIFRALPRKMRNINLLTSAFEKVYNKSFWSEPSLAYVQYWELLPLEQRYENMKTEPRPNDANEEEWVCYKKTAESIPYLKKTISLTSDIKKRADLIRLLVKTCHLNDDKKALLHLCKYMLTKHRNDHVSVRKAFLSMICMKFKLEELESEHWAALEELMQLFTLNKESFSNENFLEGYIRFRLEQNLPVKEQLTEWIKENHYNLNLARDKPEHEKYCLLTFGELIPELFTEERQGDNEDTEFSRRTDSFIGALQHWNGRFPKDKISLFSYPYVLRRVTELVQEARGKWNITRYIEYIIKTEDDCKEKEDLINLYLSKPDIVDIKIIRWLTFHRPLVVFHNLEPISKCLLEESYYRLDYFFWKWWRNYTHLNNFRKLIDISLEKVKREMGAGNNNTCMLENAVRSLSYLMTAEEFKTFITPYYPSELRAEGKTKADKARYALQQQIGETLKNVIPPSAVLESILNFCKGDYLKLVQKSLYSVSSAVAEDKLPSFFNELSDRAVSTRKHSMNLALRVLDREHVLSVLKHFMEKEKNPSLRKFILKGVFNFFVANPDDLTWEMVKSNIHTVDMENSEALDVFMQVEKIPAQYVPQYITFTWNILDVLPDPHGRRESHKSSLLRAISPDIVALLPDDFINLVLENFFFKTATNTVFNAEVQDLACKYIIYCNSPEEQQTRLNACFDVVKNYVSNMWSEPAHRNGCRNCLANFIKEFCTKFLNKQTTKLDILEKFRDAWNTIFQPHQGIKEYLHLELTILIFQNMSVPQLAQKIALLCDSLGNTYSFAVVEPFYSKMDFLSKHFMSKTSEDWYLLADSILKSATSAYSMALVVLILSKHRSYHDELQEKYEEMIALLQKNKNSVLEMYLEDHFRDGSTALDYH